MDWEPAAGPDLVQLERQLQQLLDALMNYEVPIDKPESQGTHNPENLKRTRRVARSKDGTPNSSDTDSDTDEEDAERRRRGVRRLCELFVTAPLDEIEDYAQLVKNVLDLETIRENLRLHKYRTVRKQQHHHF